MKKVAIFVFNDTTHLALPNAEYVVESKYNGTLYYTVRYNTNNTAKIAAHNVRYYTFEETEN